MYLCKFFSVSLFVDLVYLPTYYYPDLILSTYLPLPVDDDAQGEGGRPSRKSLVRFTFCKTDETLEKGALAFRSLGEDQKRRRREGGGGAVTEKEEKKEEVAATAVAR